MDELSIAYDEIAEACWRMGECENSIRILVDNGKTFLNLEAAIEDLPVLTEAEKGALVPVVHHLYLMMKQYTDRTQIDFDRVEAEVERLNKKIGRLEQEYDKMEAR